VDGWRWIAVALLVAGGLVLVLQIMAKVRERRGATGGTVAIAGAITLTALALLCLLVATVLAPWLVWTAVVLIGITVTVMLLAS
jgi:hypothetical protein